MAVTVYCVNKKTEVTLTNNVHNGGLMLNVAPTDIRMGGRYFKSKRKKGDLAGRLRELQEILK